MKIRIQSGRGDHSAEVCEEVAEAIFNKMTGKTKEALPADLRTKVPDTFQELEFLWKPGKLSFPAIENKDDLMKSFRPEATEVLFLIPHIGG